MEVQGRYLEFSKQGDYENRRTSDENKEIKKNNGLGRRNHTSNFSSYTQSLPSKGRGLEALLTTTLSYSGRCSELTWCSFHPIHFPQWGWSGNRIRLLSGWKFSKCLTEIQTLHGGLGGSASPEATLCTSAPAILAVGPRHAMLLPASPPDLTVAILSAWRALPLLGLLNPSSSSNIQHQRHFLKDLLLDRQLTVLLLSRFLSAMTLLKSWFRSTVTICLHQCPVSPCGKDCPVHHQPTEPGSQKRHSTFIFI